MKCSGVFWLLEFTAGSIQPLKKEDSLKKYLWKRAIFCCGLPQFLLDQERKGTLFHESLTLRTRTSQLSDLLSALKKEYIYCTNNATTASLSDPPPRTAPHAAGLRPRGDEADQSDQSTEITVIPEVRTGAPGHVEFTQPTQAPNKSGQEWQTFGHEKLRNHLYWADTFNCIEFEVDRDGNGPLQSRRAIDRDVYIEEL